MFFKKLFQKDFRFYLERGEKFFEEERFAEARDAFDEALRKIGNDADDADSTAVHVKKRLAETGNMLGHLNLSEGELALNRGDVTKARDHLGLVLELAEDVTLREKAEKLLGNLSSPEPAREEKAGNHGCATCASTEGKTSVPDSVAGHQLADEDRFELITQTLPEDLPGRYRSLGEKFACGYLLIHDGEDEAGCSLFEELLAEGENDILLYEIALVHHRQGRMAECERLLRRALTLNSRNPLCHVGLVHLLADTGRIEEAIPLLRQMIENQLMVDQARLMLGDVYLTMGDDNEAMEWYSVALSDPASARSAAERLVPLMEKHGRLEEAVHLAKRFLKGCC